MKNKNQNNWLKAGIMAAAFAIATTAHATTPGFLTPDFRGSANSQYGLWETFVNATGTNAANSGDATSAILDQTTAGAFPLGGGERIYWYGGPLNFTLTDSVPFDLGTVVVQTHTYTGSTELDYSSMILSYDLGLGVQTVAPVLSYALQTTDGVSYLWQWDLTGLNITSYSLSFSSAGGSTSFDSLTLDTFDTFTPVPEPSTYALAGLGLFLTGIMIKRRKQNA